MDKATKMPECRCDCVNCVTGNHGGCYYRPSVCPFGPASGAPDAVDVRSTESTPSESTGTSPISRRTENGLRLHDQHCAWCDCEEFAAVQYGSLHHLSERAVNAVSAAVTLADTEFAAGRGAEEIIEIDEDGKVSGPLLSGPFREP